MKEERDFDEIYDALSNLEFYQGDEEMGEILTNIFGETIKWYDDKIDNGIDEECEDEYVYCSCFSNKQDTIIVRLYYGNNSLNIFDFDYRIN